MKSAITRILTIAMLTASISAFAISDDATAAGKKNSNIKSEKAAVTCPADQVNCCEHARREADEQAAREKLIEKENQEWLAELMYNR